MGGSSGSMLIRRPGLNRPILRRSAGRGGVPEPGTYRKVGSSFATRHSSSIWHGSSLGIRRIYLVSQAAASRSGRRSGGWRGMRGWAPSANLAIGPLVGRGARHFQLEERY